MQVRTAWIPSAVALAASLINQFVLPQPSHKGDGDQARSGWQSLSDWAPSRLTRLTERAAAQNNELPL